MSVEDVPSLNRADLLIENHEEQDAGCTNVVEQSMRERFKDTHLLTWRRTLDRKSSLEQFASLWKGKINEHEFCAYSGKGDVGRSPNAERKVIFQNLSSQTSVSSVRDLFVPPN
jgi:hypothetical protein